MSYFSDIQVSGLALRREVIEESRLAGKFGSPRLPASVHAIDPSDSVIVACLDAHAKGLVEYETLKESKPTYMQWLGENLPRLMDQCIESGTNDGGKWVRQQFTIETGQVAPP